MDTLPLSPSPKLTFQFIEFTCCNDKFNEVVINQKHVKYCILVPCLRQLRWQLLPPLNTTTICGIIHRPFINKLRDMGIPQIKN